MTEAAARTWLSSHHDIIPALEVNHRRALEILEDHARTLRDLADVIVLDPGMSVSLYHEVNARRDAEHVVDSVHAALALMDEDFSLSVREVDLPVHILWGEADPIAPLRTGRMLAGLLPDAELVAIGSRSDSTANRFADR